ncbi:hypothetical protein [Oerskovia paurometabola]|uniref:hypothetical protein n=1 Tax=Oerskovia paurometabola TaxID=162170 RepID=UPI003427E070
MDAIAADAGVSRETVRRARNALVVALEATSPHPTDEARDSLGLPPLADPNKEMVAAGRALRRLLTLTGPLGWDEVLTAWERAGGRPPYTQLPTDIDALDRWAEDAGGIAGSLPDGVVTVTAPEPLDQVSQFLFTTLSRSPGGIERAQLLESAELAGLKSSTIATALSQHPAVVRRGRGTWALRGRQSRGPVTEKAQAPAPRRPRARPTAFRWSSGGELVIEFSVPRGPSPVIAVPYAVAEFVEGREFTLHGGSTTAGVSVGNAKLWGFGPMLAAIGVSPGERAQLSLDLLAGTATLTSDDRKDHRG